MFGPTPPEKESHTRGGSILRSASGSGIDSVARTLLWSTWALLLLALVLRLAFLGRESLFVDEVNTVDLSVKSVSQILGDRGDPHPPLYYLAMHFWLQWGDSEAFVRFPSAIVGAFTILLILLLGRNLLSSPAAWLVALLLAVSPTHVWYSQEARMYALLAMWTVSSAYFWVKLLQGNGKYFWLGYVLTTTLGLYTQYTMGLLILAQNIFVFARWIGVPSSRQQFPLPKWLLAQLAVVLLYLPWMPMLPNHWRLIRDSTTYPLWSLSTAPALLGLALGCSMLFAGLVLWIRRSDRFSVTRRREVWIVALTLLILLYLALTVLTMINRLTVFKHQTFVIFPFLCLALVALLARVPHWGRYATALILVSLTATVVSGMVLQKPPWREAVSWIDSEARPGDAVVVSPFWLRPVFSYYTDSLTPIFRVKPNQLESQAIRLQARFERAWLISIARYERYEDPQHVVRAWFGEHYNLEQERRMGELEIKLFSWGREHNPIE